MKRRKFLGLFGLTAAAIAPTIASGTQKETITTNPCMDIKLPETRQIPPMPITPNMAYRIDLCAKHQTKAMNGDPTPAEKIVQHHIKFHEKITLAATAAKEAQASSRTPLWPAILFDQRIARHKRTLARLLADTSKEANAKHWQQLADTGIKFIEEEAKALGYNTEWPGIYPIFTPNPTLITANHSINQFWVPANTTLTIRVLDFDVFVAVEVAEDGSSDCTVMAPRSGATVVAIGSTD